MRLHVGWICCAAVVAVTKRCGSSNRMISSISSHIFTNHHVRRSMATRNYLVHEMEMWEHSGRQKRRNACAVLVVVLSTKPRWCLRPPPRTPATRPLSGPSCRPRGPGGVGPTWPPPPPLRLGQWWRLWWWRRSGGSEDARSAERRRGGRGTRAARRESQNSSQLTFGRSTRTKFLSSGGLVARSATEPRRGSAKEREFCSVEVSWLF